MSDFGEAVKRLRGQRRMTLQEVGDLVGVSRQTIWDWEKGRSHPGVQDVPRIAEVFRVTICDLYGVDEPHANPAGADLTPAERQALDNIARELVKLRGSQAGGRDPDRSTLLTLRNMLRDWRDLPADLQDALLASADEIRDMRKDR